MDEAQEERMTWKGKLEYLFTSFGYVVGLGNIWRFPYKCFTNGGGVYLIPYLLTVVLCTFPVLFLEMSVGQFTSVGPVQVWNISPIMRGMGWATLFNCYIVTLYYNVVLLYAFYYMIVAFVNIGGPLPWQQCQEAWRTDTCRAEPLPDFEVMQERDKGETLLSIMDSQCVTLLRQRVGLSQDDVEALTFNSLQSNFSQCLIDFTSPEEEFWNRFVLMAESSEGMNDLGAVVGRNALLLALMWVMVFYCCLRGIRSIAKIAYVTASFPFILFVILMVRGCTLSGYEIGIRFYTQPDWSKLSDMSIWSSAATQAFYSSGIAFGSHISLASFNRFRYKIHRDALIIGVVDTVTSIFGGFIVFAFLGHASYVLNQPFENLLDSGPGILFISYIQGMSRLPGAAMWTFVFFLTVFTLGLDSAFVMFWTVLVGITDSLPVLSKGIFKTMFPIVLCILSFLLGLPMVTRGGIHMLVLLDRYAADFTLTAIVILECVIVCYVYGLNRFVSDIEMMIGKRSRVFWWYWKITWSVTAPIFCLFIMIASAVGYSKPSYNAIESPASGEAIGWLLILTPVMIIVTGGAVQAVRSGSIRSALKMSPNWRPRDPEDRTGRYSDSFHNGYLTPCDVRPDVHNMSYSSGSGGSISIPSVSQEVV